MKSWLGKPFITLLTFSSWSPGVGSLAKTEQLGVSEAHDLPGALSPPLPSL